MDERQTKPPWHKTVCLREPRTLRWLDPHTLLSLPEGQVQVTQRRDFHRSFNFYDEGGKTVVMEQCWAPLVFFPVLVVSECGGVSCILVARQGADSVV